MTGPTSGNGELEKSYISVTLKSDDSLTRAEDTFEYGEAEERYVENVHFFLFKSDGSAFPVGTTGSRNYLSFTLNSNGTQPDETGRPNEGPNVSDVKDKIINFGPMGCRTGFYFLTTGMTHGEALKLTQDALQFISVFEGDVPGVSAVECGNYLDHDLEGAKKEAAAQKEVLKNWTTADMIY